MKKISAISLITGLLLAIFFSPGFLRAEETPDSAAPAPPETRMKLAYLCLHDSATLTATLSVSRDGNLLALENAIIEFSSVSGSGDATLLGKAQTTQEGIAVLTIPTAGLPADKDGLITYRASFRETPAYPAAEESIAAKPIMIRLFFSIVDSVKTLQVTAVTRDEKGQEKPVAGENIMIYVPRLFSLLKIGEIALDETGTGTLEFPKEIVGDTLGNLTVIARLEEHDIYGFAQGKNVINWGVHKQYYKAEVPSRELWTPIAPMWMIITLIIMLLGVWAHYVYAVYELIMIKRIGKENKLKL